MEEVAPMEIYTIQRPSLLPTAACAPWAPMPKSAPERLMAELAPVSRVHQVQTQAELGRTIGSAYGTTGFVGSNGSVVKTDASGVPPRGRPV
jgi:hypothetical protein